MKAKEKEYKVLNLIKQNGSTFYSYYRALDKESKNQIKEEVELLKEYNSTYSNYAFIECLIAIALMFLDQKVLEYFNCQSWQLFHLCCILIFLVSNIALYISHKNQYNIFNKISEEL